MTEQNSQTERLDKASTTLATMLDYLGLDAMIKPQEKNGKMFLSTSSEDAGRIIGKKGQTLQSLELLLNRMTTRSDVDCPWIAIDVDGYSRKGGRPAAATNTPKSDWQKENNATGDKPSAPRKRREGGEKRRSSQGGESEDRITQQGVDAAKEVKRWGESVTLRPMNPHDRRLIHVALKDDPEIHTESIPCRDGNEKMKSVVITLQEKK